MSPKAIVLQSLLLFLFGIMGAAIVASAIRRYGAGAWPVFGMLQVALLGTSLLLFGASGLSGLLLSEGFQRPSLLARAYYHSRFGRYTARASAACVVGWLALRLLHAA